VALDHQLRLALLRSYLSILRAVSVLESPETKQAAWIPSLASELVAVAAGLDKLITYSFMEAGIQPDLVVVAPVWVFRRRILFILTVGALGWAAAVVALLAALHQLASPAPVAKVACSSAFTGIN